MRLVLSFLVLFSILSYTITIAQNNITFDDQEWDSNQSIDSAFTIGDFLFSGNQKFYTNYGYNFDVYNVSIYFLFQDKIEDKITISVLDGKAYNLTSLASYQVSELSKDTLIIEGWNGSDKVYSRKFLNIHSWGTLNLNYNNINKVVIRLGYSGNSSISDYNFDNFRFIDPQMSADLGEVSNFDLGQNYPNPFNPGTTIKYSIPQNGKVLLKVYDILGSEIVTLADEYKPTGSYSVRFDGSAFPSGIYIYKLMVGSFVSSRKMMLIK